MVSSESESQSQPQSDAPIVPHPAVCLYCGHYCSKTCDCNTRFNCDCTYCDMALHEHHPKAWLLIKDDPYNEKAKRFHELVRKKKQS